ncbi:unnamed protein product [Cunninghamella blakesleeana]
MKAINVYTKSEITQKRLTHTLLIQSVDFLQSELTPHNKDSNYNPGLGSAPQGAPPSAQTSIEN